MAFDAPTAGLWIAGVFSTGGAGHLFLRWLAGRIGKGVQWIVAEWRAEQQSARDHRTELQTNYTRETELLRDFFGKLFAADTQSRHVMADALSDLGMALLSMDPPLPAEQRGRVREALSKMRRNGDGPPAAVAPAGAP